jgi:L-rhamnose mutarotase
MMRRLAFKMQLKPGSAVEYQRRHDELWPEIKQILAEAGVSEYSIFLDAETNTLFAFQKVASDGGSQDLGENETIRRWWDHMADIMETNEDNSPVSVELKEVFYMP